MTSRSTITRRDVLIRSAAATALIASRDRTFGARPEGLEQAEKLHRAIPVFLGYCVFHPEQFQARGGRQCDLEKLAAAGVRTFIASVGFGYRGPNQPYFQIGPRNYVMAGSDEWLLERQLKRIDELRSAIEACPRTRLITRASELAARPDDDSIGVIMHLIGNNHTLGVDTVDLFFRRGVRATHPAMQYHNRWCAGYNGMNAPVMTDFGREVVARMNKLGIVIDTGHASDETATALVEASVKPVNDSHTMSRDVSPQSRGLRDETLRRIARSGGVIGVHFADHMLTSEAWRTKYANRGASRREWKYNQYVLDRTRDPDERIRLREDQAARDRFYHDHNLPADPVVLTIRGANVRHLADAVDYLVRLVGIEHVGLGPDVNGIDDDQWPAEMNHIGDLPMLTAELLRRGYDEPQLRKLYSDNLGRVYAACLPS
ncbi:MAG: dipeptidase [Planctomycetia bacterium]|nr:dipeptidase [Planctomycetia bacterium]